MERVYEVSADEVSAAVNASEEPRPLLAKSESHEEGAAESREMSGTRRYAELLMPNVPLVLQICASCYRAWQGPDTIAWALLATIWVSDLALFHSGVFFKLPVPSCISLEKVGSVLLQVVVLTVYGLWIWILQAQGAGWQWAGFVAAAAVYAKTELDPTLKADFWEAGPKHATSLFTHTANLAFELSLWTLYN